MRITVWFTLNIILLLRLANEYNTMQCNDGMSVVTCNSERFRLVAQCMLAMFSIGLRVFLRNHSTKSYIISEHRGNSHKTWYCRCVLIYVAVCWSVLLDLTEQTSVSIWQTPSFMSTARITHNFMYTSATKFAFLQFSIWVRRLNCGSNFLLNLK